MRARKKKWTAGELAENGLILSELPEKGFRDYFGTDEIFLEVGCGKGGFIVKTALSNPNAAFVAFEREREIIAKAARTAREQNITNVRFVTADASSLRDWFGDGEVSAIFLNFSDPWQRKKKWAKRRLTHRAFLEIYAKILRPGGRVMMKTDNEELFDFSLSEFAEKDWRLERVTRDLHEEIYAPQIPTTEYEERFMRLGQRIFRLEASPPLY